MWTRALAVILVALACLVAPAHAAAPTFLQSATELSAANTEVILTLTGVTGSYHAIYSVQFAHSCSTAVVGTAIIALTTTNLTGSPAWTTGNACAVGGLHRDVDLSLAIPLIASAANTNTTFVCPAMGATAVCRITVTYQQLVP